MSYIQPTHKQAFESNAKKPDFEFKVMVNGDSVLEEKELFLYVY